MPSVLVVVVGGGEVAGRKIALLRRAGALLRVVSPALDSALTVLASENVFEYRAKRFDPADLDRARLVIAATDDLEVNAAVAAAARDRNIFVNVVDDPPLCDVIMPSIVDRGRVVAAISTGGAAPVLARLIRRRVEEQLPASIGRLADWSAGARTTVRDLVPDERARRAFWEWLFASDFAERLQAGRETSVADLVAAWPGPGPRGLVAIPVPAEADLLTLRDVRQIFAADSVYYQHGVAPAVLEHARRDAHLEAVATRAAAEAAAVDQGGGAGVAVYLYRSPDA